MSDPQELAKAARIILSEALQALQSSPNVPAQLLAMAEPIARAMGILHEIEASGGTRLEGREHALASVRGVLDALQAVDVNHPAVDRATEAVASSLTKLFALARATPATAPPPGGAPLAAGAPVTQRAGIAPMAAQPRAAAPVATTVMAGTPAALTPAMPLAGPAGPAMMTASPAPPDLSPGAAPPLAGGFPAAPAVAPAPTQVLPLTPQAGVAAPFGPPGADGEAARVQAEVEAARRALAEAEARATEEARRAAEARRVAEEKAAEAARRAAEAQRQMDEQARREAKVLHPVPGMEGAKLPATGTARMDVELGAHSPSNFYKGLAGNDVVDHGGIFVATYKKIPRVGTAVALRVLLPGELDFEADAVVQWTRETRSGDQQPGFGAKFTRMSGEGRHLVYRYARNREPIFYDDF